VDSSSFVIADIFDKRDLGNLEQTFSDHGFSIHKKEVITFNVKHAIQLDKPRIDKIVNSISQNNIVRRFVKNFFASAEGSKTVEELGKTKEYICYVLKFKKDTASKQQAPSGINGIGSF
jgi:hypothetical protein